ncbi:MAG: hypothetical protein ABI702_15355 [Burkholderiales bacterium]
MTDAFSTDPRGIRRHHDSLLDAVHAAAVFAWANRLMQTLGEPVPFIH